MSQSLNSANKIAKRVNGKTVGYASKVMFRSSKGTWTAAHGTGYMQIWPPVAAPGEVELVNATTNTVVTASSGYNWNIEPGNDYYFQMKMTKTVGNNVTTVGPCRAYCPIVNKESGAENATDWDFTGGEGYWEGISWSSTKEYPNPANDNKKNNYTIFTVDDDYSNNGGDIYTNPVVYAPSSANATDGTWNIVAHNAGKYNYGLIAKIQAPTFTVYSDTTASSTLSISDFVLVSGDTVRFAIRRKSGATSKTSWLTSDDFTISGGTLTAVNGASYTYDFTPTENKIVITSNETGGVIFQTVVTYVKEYQYPRLGNYNTGKSITVTESGNFTIWGQQWNGTGYDDANNAVRYNGAVNVSWSGSHTGLSASCSSSGVVTITVSEDGATGTLVLSGADFTDTSSYTITGKYNTYYTTINGTNYDLDLNGSSNTNVYLEPNKSYTISVGGSPASYQIYYNGTQYENQSVTHTTNSYYESYSVTVIAYSSNNSYAYSNTFTLITNVTPTISTNSVSFDVSGGSNEVTLSNFESPSITAVSGGSSEISASLSGSTITFTASANTWNTSSRTASWTVKDGSSQVGTITVTQAADTITQIKALDLDESADLKSGSSITCTMNESSSTGVYRVTSDTVTASMIGATCSVVKNNSSTTNNITITITLNDGYDEASGLTITRAGQSSSYDGISVYGDMPEADLYLYDASDNMLGTSVTITDAEIGTGYVYLVKQLGYTRENGGWVQDATPTSHTISSATTDSAYITVGTSNARLTITPTGEASNAHCNVIVDGTTFTFTITTKVADVIVNGGDDYEVEGDVIYINSSLTTDTTISLTTAAKSGITVSGDYLTLNPHLANSYNWTITANVANYLVESGSLRSNVLGSILYNGSVVYTVYFGTL